VRRTYDEAHKFGNGELKGSIETADASGGVPRAVDNTHRHDLAPVGGHADVLSCSAILQLVRRFLAGDEDVQRRSVVRAHLSNCASCREEYHTSVETMARLASAPRAYHEGLARAPRTIPGSPRQARTKAARSRGTSLVKLILPAFGLYAAFVMSGRAESDREVRLTALSGAVRVGEQILATDDGATVLSRSQSGSTDARSRAQIDADGVTVIVEPSTAFAIERVHPLRVRLFEGSLLFDGNVVISTNAGVMEASPGSGSVRMTERDVGVAASEGTVAFYDSRARVVVAPRENVRVPLPAVTVTPN
jgi:hypothetical protein